jgi:Cu-Zn family superoxide dismutase
MADSKLCPWSMKILKLTLTAVVALSWMGCAAPMAHDSSPEKAGEPVKSMKAVAELSPTANSKVKGTVTFTRRGDKTRVVAVLTGLTPGLHGFHIHEKGDCSAPDASSAGGHYNPTTVEHGGPDALHRHVGDFGNVEADPVGHVFFTKDFPKIEFDGPASILGRAVIIHANADDLTTQPSGNAGPRVACGVIVRTK